VTFNMHQPADGVACCRSSSMKNGVQSSALGRVSLTRVGCNAIVDYVNADCIKFAYASCLLRDLND